ncbi:hypothetical protein TKK_0017686 [Trichogramma kaykai]|uniref:Uncharacterized protein n=1 Tax=Trichogramma kaykai TaxID=54128 RepID=A0ABD2W390_9HYME
MSDDGKESEQNDSPFNASNVTEDGGEAPSRATLERFRMYEKTIINLQAQLTEQQKVIKDLCELKLSDTTPSSSAPTTSAQVPRTSNCNTITTSSQLSSGTQTTNSSSAYKFSIGPSLPAHDVKPPPMNPQAFVFTARPMQFAGNQNTMPPTFGASANVTPSVFSQSRDSTAGQAPQNSLTFGADHNNNDNSTY